MANEKKIAVNSKKLFYLFIIFILSSCGSVLDKPLNKDDFEKVKDKIQTNKNYGLMKKKYIVDNLTMQVGFVELGNIMKSEKNNIPTFKKQIEDLSASYDSINKAFVVVKETNKKLDNLISLVDAETYSSDIYKGNLAMKIKFTNLFEKEILYAIINYSYINKYDTEFFNEKVKLTDDVANDFNGEVEITTTEEYNSVANFLYTKVPVVATDELRKELGKEEADKKVEHDFLMEGLKVSVLGVVFKDKTELTYTNDNWDYYEE
jgi:hypothetical protein